MADAYRGGCYGTPDLADTFAAGLMDDFIEEKAPRTWDSEALNGGTFTVSTAVPATDDFRGILHNWDGATFSPPTSLTGQ